MFLRGGLCACLQGNRSGVGVYTICHFVLFLYMLVDPVMANDVSFINQDPPTCLCMCLFLSALSAQCFEPLLLACLFAYLPARREK